MNIKTLIAALLALGGIVLLALGQERVDPVIGVSCLATAAAIAGAKWVITSAGKKMAGPLPLLAAALLLPSCASVDEVAEKVRLPVADSAFYSGAVVASFVEAIAAADTNHDGVIAGTSEWTLTLTRFATELYRRILERP